jgi:hypothetical protein
MRKNMLCPINNVKNFRKLLFFGVLLGSEVLSRRLIYRVDGKNNK